MTIANSASNASLDAPPPYEQCVGEQLPSAPSPGLVLFNTEEQSDIVFTVGIDQEAINTHTAWRFPAHSFIVAEASPIFAEMIRTQVDPYRGIPGVKPEIRIHCPPEIFHILLSYIYKKELNIGSVSNGLLLAPISSGFKLHELTHDCLTFLKSNANSGNVLEILSWLRRAVPSHPQSFEGYENSAENALNELKTKCYHILDANAEKILRSEATDNLEQEMLIEILSRDSLRLTSEATVFDCLLDWACQQCLKQRRELVGENKRDVLGKAIYSARYLVMSLDEFIKGPYSCDLLSDEEKTALLARLNGDISTPLPMHLLGRKLDVLRKYVKPTGLVSPTLRQKDANAVVLPDPATNGKSKKNSASKKLLNGLSGFMICVIQLLD